jgi:hypothetical protein
MGFCQRRITKNGGFLINPLFCQYILFSAQNHSSSTVSTTFVFRAAVSGIVSVWCGVSIESLAERFLKKGVVPKREPDYFVFVVWKKTLHYKSMSKSFPSSFVTSGLNVGSSQWQPRLRLIVGRPTTRSLEPSNGPVETDWSTWTSFRVSFVGWKSLVLRNRHTLRVRHGTFTNTTHKGILFRCVNPRKITQRSIYSISLGGLMTIRIFIMESNSLIKRLKY